MTIADDILTPVYLRLRDPSRTATPVAQALLILSNAQRALNLKLLSVVQTTSLNTVSGTALYALNANLPLIARADHVQQGTRNIPKLSEERLWFFDKNWLSATTTGETLAWAPIGRDLLAIYPSKTGTVVVSGPKQILDFSGISVPVQLQDQHIPALEDMLELEMAFRLRLWEAFQAAQARLNSKFKVIEAAKQ